ncbi:hypothetical protein C1645_469866 [Glomus cerebriforme]|uniref:Uncharacterized protein n=1 Tax=Glomus cerebriforme TaxID=658196 RepID=A0A397SGX9_9GLOM|nr:hypothetical protein C1645_469866 [Glomus cerebriforme]
MIKEGWSLALIERGMQRRYFDELMHKFLYRVSVYNITLPFQNYKCPKINY